MSPSCKALLTYANCEPMLATRSPGFVSPASDSTCTRGWLQVWIETLLARANSAAILPRNHVEDPLLAPRRVRITVLALSACLGAIVGLPAAASAAQLSGRVLAADRPVAASRVTLYASGERVAARLGSARTNARGRFELSYSSPGGDPVLYAVASGGRTPARGALRLMAVAGPAGAPPRRLTVNELTTVASAYSLSRFLRGVKLIGPSPGLPNAAATVPSLVRPATGRVGSAVANPPNGTATDTLATLRTLAAIVGGCTRGTRASCRALFRAARPPRGRRPADTLQAIHDIALHPANHVRRIFRLRKARAYRPILRSAPSSWVLSLKHTDAAAQYDGPGRMAFDSQGNIWVTNNFQPPGTDAGPYVISLDPAGHPRNGGAVKGGGILGNWWGIAIDRMDRVWLSNFTGDDPNEFYSPDFKGGNLASLLTSTGEAVYNDGTTAGNLQAPQGIAVDQNDNVWIANHGGNSVTLYPGGDPNQAREITGGGLFKPFTVAIDAQGNAWVDNGAIDANAPAASPRSLRTGSRAPTSPRGGCARRRAWRSTPPATSGSRASSTAPSPGSGRTAASRASSGRRASRAAGASRSTATTTSGSRASLARRSASCAGGSSRTARRGRRRATPSPRG
jgi:hypothetical protein